MGPRAAADPASSSHAATPSTEDAATASSAASSSSSSTPGPPRVHDAALHDTGRGSTASAASPMAAAAASSSARPSSKSVSSTTSSHGTSAATSPRPGRAISLTGPAHHPHFHTRGRTHAHSQSQSYAQAHDDPGAAIFDFPPSSAFSPANSPRPALRTLHSDSSATSTKSNSSARSAHSRTMSHGLPALAGPSSGSSSGSGSPNVTPAGAGGSSSSNSSSSNIRVPTPPSSATYMPTRLGSVLAMPPYRRTQTHSSNQSGQSETPASQDEEGAASVSLRSLQDPADRNLELAKLDLREIAIRKFHLDDLKGPALNRLKMAHELVIRSCNMSLCASIFCTDTRILVANETTNRDKHAIAKVEDRFLRVLFEYVTGVKDDVVCLPNLRAFAEKHGCAPTPFQTFVASAVRIPPFASSEAIVVGMLAAFDVTQRDKLSEEDDAFMRHLSDAASFVIKDQFAATRRRGELLAQKAIVDLNRQLTGEAASRRNSSTNDTQGDGKAREGNTAALFSNAAQALCDALDADAALILDASSFRLRADPKRSLSSTGSSLGLATSSSGDASSSVDTASMDTPELPQDQAQMGQPCPPLTPPTFKRELSEISQTLEGMAQREPSQAIMDTETSCFFGLSSEPLAILGSSGDGVVLAHFRDLGGRTSRPCIARFLASRQLTRSFGETKAEGEYSAGRANLLRKPDSLVPLLPEKCQGLLAAPVFELNRQPAFVIIATFKDPPYRWEEPDYLLIEQIGAVLLSSVHRSRARAVDRAQTYFMHKVSHELRTPLHAILGVTEMTRMALPPQSQELLSLVDSINLAADSLSTTINDLVDFNALTGSILDAAGGRVNNAATSTSVFDIFGAVSDAAVAQYLYRRRVLRQADLTRRHGEDEPESNGLLPPELFIHLSPIGTPVEGKVELDIEAVRRIVSKIISNALRATETGIIIVSATISHIFVSAGDDDETELAGQGGGDQGLQARRGSTTRRKQQQVPELEIVISDTGKGMSEDFIRARLFQPFSQADPFSSGTGLSLTLCRNMIDELGGRVQVSSTPDRGTTFWIHVPLHADHGLGLQLKDPAGGGRDRPSGDGKHGRRSGSIGVGGGGGGTIGPYRSFGTSRSRIPALFTGFEDESNSGLRTYRSQLMRQFDLWPVDETESERAKVIFLLSEAVEDGSASETLRSCIRAASVGSAHAQGTVDGGAADPYQQAPSGRFEAAADCPLIVNLQALGFDTAQAQARAQELAETAKAERCQVITLQRPLGLKSLLFLDDVIRRKVEGGVGQLGPRASGSTRAAEAAVRAALPAGLLGGQGHGVDRSIGGVDLGESSDDARAGAGRPADQPFHVLVVEDNPLNARIVTTMLRKIGVDYHEATNGRQAVEMYRKYQHDVVLMDISMPEMDGFEACEKMKALEGSEWSHIIAITALSSEKDRIRGRECGFSDWIVKPVRLGPLAEDVKRWKERAYLPGGLFV